MMTNIAYNSLKKVFQKHSIISDINSILYWDLATMLPEKSWKERSLQLEYLNKLKHEIMTSKSVKDLFEKVEEQDLDFKNKRNFLEMRKEFLYLNSLPEELVKKKSKLSIQCEGLWIKAKKEKNFKVVEETFERLVNVIIEESEILSQSMDCSPYDSLLKQYEDSYSSSDIDILFNKIKPEILELYPEVIKKQKNQELIPFNQEISKETQYVLCKEVMKEIGFDFKRGRFDKSEHPFCGGSTDDIRITTKYIDENFFAALEASMHETGHALYELGLPKNWRHQPIGKSGGMALHESQSLLIEMQIYRSLAFKKYLEKKLRKNYNYNDISLNAQNLFGHCNKVAKSFIRIYSDEVTYPLHIILRYNLEKKILSREISVKDLPHFWNELFFDTFDIRVLNDSQGCLQDIHWYGGAFGYFPTYSLGAMISAQITFKLKKDIPNFDKKIMRGDFKEIIKWIKKNIHQKGRLYNTQEIVNQSSGQPLEPSFFLNYLKRKYL